MRGGSQAHLLKATDGQLYVVKFQNNPQHRRILVNEWLGSFLMRFVGIACPSTAVVHITEDFLRRNPGVYLETQQGRERPKLGKHFGSRYPGTSGELKVHEFLRKRQLAGIVNWYDFIGALTLDVWAANRDPRQAIFVQPPASRSLVGPVRFPPARGCVAQMIDNGHWFNGAQWNFAVSARNSVYLDRSVYRSIDKSEVFEPWLEALSKIPAETIWAAAAAMPSEWIEGDLRPLTELLTQFLHRRECLPQLMNALIPPRHGLPGAQNEFDRPDVKIGCTCAVPCRLV